MKKFFKIIKKIIETVNCIYCFAAATATLIGVYGYIKDAINKEAAEKQPEPEVKKVSEPDYDSDDLDIFLFKGHH